MDNTTVITEETHRTYHFKKVVAGLDEKMLYPSDEKMNIFRIVGEDGGTIGFASLYKVEYGLLVDGFIKYNIPERLNVETDNEEYLNVFLKDSKIDYLSIANQSSEFSTKITGELSEDTE